MTMIWISQDMKEYAEYTEDEDYIDSLYSEQVFEYLDNKKNWKEQIIRKEESAFNAIEKNMPLEKRPLIISSNQRAQFRDMHIQTFDKIVQLKKKECQSSSDSELEEDLDLDIVNRNIILVPSYRESDSRMKCLFCENKMNVVMSWIIPINPKDVRFYDLLATANENYENIEHREYQRKFILSHVKINRSNTTNNTIAKVPDSRDTKAYIFGICTEHLIDHIKEVIKDIDKDVKEGRKSISFEKLDEIMYNCFSDEDVAMIYHMTEHPQPSPFSSG